MGQRSPDPSDDLISDPAGSRRRFLKAGLAAVGAAAAPGLAAGPLPAAESRPNLLILLGEGLRPDVLSSAGNRLGRTPHLDRIAAEGTTFSNAFVTNSLCLPGRATVMTGLYSHVTGTIDNRDRPIPPQFPILPDLLHQAGYEVAFVGKSHVRGALRDHYWDYYFGFNGQANYYHPEIVEGEKGTYGPAVRYDGYVEDLLGDRAVAWLQRRTARPFCLFYWPYAPHAPFYRPRRYLDLFNGVAVPKPDTFDEDLKGYPGKPRAFIDAVNKIGTTQVGNDDPRSLEELVKNYNAGLMAMDDNVGRIFQVLEQRGEYANTAVVLHSDHGFFLGEWRMYDKRLMHEPSIRVPLIVRQAGGKRLEATVKSMALNLDIAPTVLDLAGVKVPSSFQGRSLMPWLRGEQPAWRSDWLYEYYEYPEYEHVRPNRGVRTERYKLIHYFEPPEEFELYDLREDPGEKRNLYGEPQFSGLGRELLARIAELRRETGDTPQAKQLAEALRNIPQLAPTPKP